MQKIELKESNEQKKYLKSYKQAVIAAKCIEEELIELKLSKMCPSVLVDGMPHGKNGTGDLSGYAVKAAEAEEKLRAARYLRIKLYTEIVDSIESMADERDKNLLRLKYLHFKTWEEVSLEMGYSYKQIHRIHSAALSRFKEDIE